ncbi:hypothetical protein Nepgr_029664 [Nepenthes gracilis]|uniref:Uncharacterized protein n=1 Tax=Nepenthes gracilis TaxID=150966 RepID=A0AAD3TEQ6_NEPGR|nr:hypothetical protein Nepgr_029664 [Nepenthes gracilis]
MPLQLLGLIANEDRESSQWYDICPIVRIPTPQIGNRLWCVEVGFIYLANVSMDENSGREGILPSICQWESDGVGVNISSTIVFRQLRELFLLDLVDYMMANCETNVLFWEFPSPWTLELQFIICCIGILLKLQQELGFRLVLDHVWVLWWTALSVASSIGLGLRLSTFVQHLKPHISQFTIKGHQLADVCRSWLDEDCSNIGPPLFNALHRTTLEAAAAYEIVTRHYQPHQTRHPATWITLLQRANTNQHPFRGFAPTLAEGEGYLEILETWVGARAFQPTYEESRSEASYNDHAGFAKLLRGLVFIRPQVSVQALVIVHYRGFKEVVYMLWRYGLDTNSTDYVLLQSNTPFLYTNVDYIVLVAAIVDFMLLETALEMEHISLCMQIEDKDPKISTPFPILLPWMPFKLRTL